jgi:hypothetical protein
VFLVSGHGIVLGHYTYYTLGKPASAVCSSHDREDMLKIFCFSFQCWFGRNVTCDVRGKWSVTLTTMGVCHTYTLSKLTN